MPVARPSPERIAVCLLCGSTDPDRVDGDCTHPTVARFESLPGPLSELLVRLRRARAFQQTALETLQEAARLEAAAGRCIVDDESDVVSPGANVVFLRPRGELVEDDAPPPVPARRAPTKPKHRGPRLELKPPKPKRRWNGNVPPGSHKKRVDTSTPTLFDDEKNAK